MDIHFKDNDTKVKVIGASIAVECKKCGKRYSFRLGVDGLPPTNFNFCINCAVIEKAKGESNGQ